MRAIKSNRVYTIMEADVESFAKEGYDIYDNEGNLVKHGAGKSVPYEKYEALLADYEKLMTENAELQSELSSLKEASAENSSRKVKKVVK